ncbi:MAG TPA: PhzF family phenazine biosynthesis protein [Xanthobacteraceae bacterium]|jgi:trans-2,3-dihydro-3-hydroxyanthranilate isomerase|nr:PhzF family phenazine biosynthesis protein [Xanthobacteraceae bacterium]
MQVKFVTVDVFTDKQFGGNPLAVVADGTGLSTPQMRAIAAEFNLAETTFVLPPQNPAHTAQVRIFTPRAELPFAGHPNVGTAFVLARNGECHGRPITGDVLEFEEIAGLVRIDLFKQASKIVGARLAAPQPLTIGDIIANEVIAEACTVAASDIETRNHQPCIAGCGMPLVMVELKDLKALAAAQPRGDAFARHLPTNRATGIHLYVHTGRDGIDIQSRMFAPLHGVPEDPATGSANVALIGLLAELRPEPDLRLEKIIAQGIEMGRPSRLDALAEKRAGKVTATYIGGRCVPMMQGVIALD